jgi:hypothetical protein
VQIGDLVKMANHVSPYDTDVRQARRAAQRTYETGIVVRINAQGIQDRVLVYWSGDIAYLYQKSGELELIE